MARTYFDKSLKWWCIDYLNANGRRKQVKAGRTKTIAESMLRKTLDEVSKEMVFGNTLIKPIRFIDFMNDHYLPYSKVNKRPSSYNRDTFSAKPLGSV